MNSDDPGTHPNAPSSSRNWLNRNVLGISLTSLFSDMSHEMATAILPFFIIAIGGNAAIVGLVEGASDGGSSAIKAYAGHYSDKAGKRTPIMYLGYALTGVLIPAIGFASSWIEVFLLRVIAWMGRGVRSPPRDALLSDSAPSSSIGRAFGFQRSFDTIGAVIGIGIALVLVPILPLSQIFFVSLIPGIFSVLIVLFLVKDVKRKVTAAKSFRSSVSALSRSFKLFLVGVALFGVANFSNVLFTLRADEILMPSLGVRAAYELSILLYLVLNIVYASVSYGAGFFADKISKKFLLALGYFFFALACFASVFEVPQILILVVIFVLAGTSIGIVDPLEGAFASEMLDASERGTGYGILQTVNGVGDFVSSTMIGVLWTLLTPALGFATVGGISVVAAGLIVFLIPRKVRGAAKI